MSSHIDAIQESKEKIEVKGIAKVFSCFKSQPRLQNELSDERDLIFAIARVKYDSSLAEHDLILKHTYKLLTQSKSFCRSVGEHWQDIGF